MKGIRYITDEEGERSAVVIDLKTYGEQLEDFLDGLEAEQRINEAGEEHRIVMERVIKAKRSDG